MKNPLRALVEMFLPPEEVSPLKALPMGHPQKQYCYTLVGFNDLPLSAKTLVTLGFIGQVRASNDYVVANDELLWKDLNTVVQIGRLYNIHKIRKYHDTGHGIEWESTTKLVYNTLIQAQLFDV